MRSISRRPRRRRRRPRYRCGGPFSAGLLRGTIQIFQVVAPSRPAAANSCTAQAMQAWPRSWWPAAGPGRPTVAFATTSCSLRPGWAQAYWQPLTVAAHGPGWRPGPGGTNCHLDPWHPDIECRTFDIRVSDLRYRRSHSILKTSISCAHSISNVCAFDIVHRYRRCSISKVTTFDIV
jgi:hypothetical protein